MAKKKDVGMAGSSGYDSEFYTTDKKGIVERNDRMMQLQGMDPLKRHRDSVKQVMAVNARVDADMPMTDRDKARAKAVGGRFKVTETASNNGDGRYNENDLQNEIIGDTVRKRDIALDRRKSADVDIAKQKQQASVTKKYGDNSFKPFTQNVPTLSSQIRAANAKKK
jgi:hypothetical protein